MLVAPPVIKDDVGAVKSALDRTRKGFATGKTKPLAFRVQQLVNLKKGMQSLEKEINEAVQKDLGREAFVTWFTEIAVVQNEIDHAIANLKKWSKPVCAETPMYLGPAKSSVVYEPLGVVCVIGSWNFPLFTTLMPLISVIAAGNCAVIKPSEVAPHVSLKIKQLILRNLDGDCYRPVEGLVEVAKALTSSNFDGICFTGSTEKGKLVAAAAAKNLVPCVLELGGKCPVVVDESANLEFAAKEISRARFLNCGQTCVATDYVLLHYSVTDRFMRILEKEIKSQWKDGTNVADMGKVVNEFHHDRLKSLLKGHQGTVVIGNPEADFLQPTVVLNPSRESDLMKDEIFGPILPVVSYQTIDEAIKFIKAGDKPLAVYYFGSTFGKNRERLEKETSSGALVTNDTVFQIANSYLPFGGVGASGYGRYHGYEGFKQFSNAKSVFTKPPMTTYPYNKVFPPFTKDKQSLIRFLIKYLQCTQTQFVKRLFWLLVVLYILKQIAVGNLSMKTYRKWKSIFKMIGSMLPMLMK